jgi:hypothetical protein
VGGAEDDRRIVQSFWVSTVLFTEAVGNRLSGPENRDCLLQSEIADQKIDMERAINHCSEIDGDGPTEKTLSVFSSV